MKTTTFKSLRKILKKKEKIRESDSRNYKRIEISQNTSVIKTLQIIKEQCLRSVQNAEVN